MNKVLDYAKGLNANDEIISWLNTTYKKYAKNNPTSHEIEHIIDYLISDASPTRLRKMSYVDAKRKAAEWSKANQKKGRNIIDSDDDIEIVHDFLDGTKIVRLKTKSAFQREGFLMGHCLGGYTPNDKEYNIYSYRDKKNMPHATLEVLKDRGGQINQIKGKGNGSIHPKYVHPILTFLRLIGYEIRPKDMANLGYYHIPSEHLPFLRRFPKAMDQITVINGESYTRE